MTPSGVRFNGFSDDANSYYNGYPTEIPNFESPVLNSMSNSMSQVLNIQLQKSTKK